ncbi:MAG: dihydrodipicolinate synthase family protein [Planctomycetota bacterium]|nr:dihydrodipicolinate synthase family protein [Planctomycetota bacterium]MDA1212834.1 dihydrodipicolinate synthase family protein [Planctomycetota bacterium]
MKRYPSCIMATCEIPWNEKGEFAEEIFRKEVRHALKETKHVYIFGTAGEGYAVSERLFDTIVNVFNEEMRDGDAEPMVGVINLSLPTIIERIERCRQLGIRRFQISLPSWGALNDTELFEFFRQVCGKFTDCQFLHYNLMRTKRLVTPQEYARLAQEHPNFVATKNSTDNMGVIQELIDAVPEMQHFITETAYAFGSQFGECGILASLVTSWPKLNELFEAGKKQDLKTLTKFHREVRKFHQILFDAVGDSAHIDGAYDKMFTKIHIPEFPLRLLPPYAYVSDERFNNFVATMKKELPDWLP